MATQKEIKKKTQKKKPQGYIFGRPTKYTKTICARMYRYFDIEATKEVEVDIITKAGIPLRVKKIVPNRIPLLQEFGRHIGVNRSTLVEWAKKHKDFSVTYEAIKDMQESMLIYQALNGLVNIPFAMLLAKNITSLRDRVENDITSGGKPIESVNLTDFISSLKGKTDEELQRLATAKSGDQGKV